MSKVDHIWKAVPDLTDELGIEWIDTEIWVRIIIKRALYALR
jgi:hypothetical protein